jgi:hypothetical protein
MRRSIAASAVKDVQLIVLGRNAELLLERIGVALDRDRVAAVELVDARLSERPRRTHFRMYVGGSESSLRQQDRGAVAAGAGVCTAAAAAAARRWLRFLRDN